MTEIYKFLSSGIPGGIISLILALLVINLMILFFKSSKLIDASAAIKKALTFSSIIILIYISLWFLLRPPLPQVRVIVLPSTENGRISLNAASIRLSDNLQKLSSDNMTTRFLFHHWEWLMQTMGQDSLASPDHWKNVALALNPGILIESDRKENHWECKIYSNVDGEKKSESFKIYYDTKEFSEEINDEYQIFVNVNIQTIKTTDLQLQTAINIVQNNLDRADQLIASDTSSYGKLLKAKILVKKGLQEQIDREKAKYVKVNNKYFDKAKPLLHRLRIKRFALAEVAYFLGRIALREEDFNSADVYLKTALSLEPANPRIHFGLSFLHFTRIQELGYANRVEILEKALYLDPGYRDVVYELANLYYISGTGTQAGMGTTLAMQTIENYLKISQGDGEILSLLGSIYIKIQKLDEALEIYKDLQIRFPDDSNMAYNIGVVLFFKRDYEQALTQFLHAISIDENLDSYLYAGIIYRQLGDDEKALEYYRERVRRKTGNDDQYAREAMAGIRKILEVPNGDSTK